jgi:SNF2 family DNA or RNA helicase
MCGTPVTQGSPDVFSPSLAVDKGKKYGLSQKIFIDKYFGRYGQRLVAKSRTHKELSDKLFENALRFTKKECLDLPDKLFTTIPVELPKENRDAYEQMATYLMTYINEKEEVTAPILLVQLLRLSQITSGFSKNVDNKIVEFKQQPKLDVLKELLEQNNSHQLIVWSRFVRDVKAIASLAKSMGMTYGCLVGKNQDEYKSDAQIEMQVQMVDNRLVVMPQITGSDGNKYSDIVIPNSPYQRNEIKDKFNKGDIQIIVGTAATGGLGLDLIGDQLDLENKEEVVIYYANDYSLLNRLQSEDRAHRSGQTKKVMYYDLIAQDTVDVGVMKIIFGKKAVADVITRDNLLKLMEGKDV